MCRCIRWPEVYGGDNILKPPFLGTRVVDDIDIQQVFDLIDRDVLYAARWQLRGDLPRERWQERVERVAVPTFDRMVHLCTTKNIVKPRAVQGHFACERKGNVLFVKGERQTYTFDFPRERQSPNRCLADFFPAGFVTMQLVTIGHEVANAGAELFKNDNYTDAFYLKGFAAEASEALASYVQRRCAEGMGLPSDAGVRFSFGYPTCPNLMDQKKLYTLLGGNRIGVALSRTMHLIPEHSTSAIISFDEHASRFIP